MKVLAAVFVALLAIQATTQSPLEDDSVKTTIVDLLTQILDAVEPILEEAQNLAEKLNSDPETVSTKVVSIVSELAVKLHALLLKGVNELADDASDDANTVIQCINAEEDETNAALKQTIELATSCISEKYSDIYNATNEVLKDLADLDVDIKGQVTTLSECADSDLVCLYNFLQTLYTTAVKIIDKLPADVIDIVNVAEVVVAQLKSCDLAPGIKVNAETILDQVAKCIKA